MSATTRRRTAVKKALSVALLRVDRISDLALELTPGALLILGGILTVALATIR